MPKMRTLTLFGAALLIGCSGPTRPPEEQSPIMARLWIDQVEAYPGTVSDLCVRLSSDGNPAIAAEEIGGLDFLLYYDLAALSFQSIKPDSVLSDWEYWTYRLMEPNKVRGDSIALVRIQATRDLNNGIDSPAPLGLTDGPLLRLGFLATPNWEFTGTDSPVGFWRESCNDNTIWHADDPTDLLIANMDYSPGENYLAFDTLACPRRLGLDPSLAFQSGLVHITEPPDDRSVNGDLDLDGVHFGLSDLAAYIEYFTSGTLQWDPVDSVRQLEATDCNYDGELLTVADLEFLIHVNISDIHWWQQISGVYGDTVYLSTEEYNDELIVHLSATAPVGALYLQWESPSEDAAPVKSILASQFTVFSTESRGTNRFLAVALDGEPVPVDRRTPFISIGALEEEIHFEKPQASTYPGVPMAVVWQ